MQTISMGVAAVIILEVDWVFIETSLRSESSCMVSGPMDWARVLRARRVGRSKTGATVARPKAQVQQRSYRGSASAITTLVSGLPPLLAISIARLLDSGLRATFWPAVQTCARKYSLPYLWNTRRLFSEGELA